MTIISALLPTLSALADAATDPSVAAVLDATVAPASAHAEPGASIHKYIIFQDQVTGQEHPVIFSRDIQHSSFARYDLKAVSAGFVLISGRTLAISDIGSDTLNLAPRPQDREILRTWLGLSCPSVPPST